MYLAERLGGMTATELAERLDEHPGELALWILEDHIRDEEKRDATLLARARAAVGK